MDEWRVVLRPTASPVLSSTTTVDNSDTFSRGGHPWNASQSSSTNGQQIVKRTTRAISTLRTSSASSHDGSTSSDDDEDEDSEDSTTTAAATTATSLCPLCLQTLPRPRPRPRPRSVTPPSITPLPPDSNYFNRLSLSLSAYSSRNASRDGSPEGSRRTTPVLSHFTSINSGRGTPQATSSHTPTTQDPATPTPQQDSNPILPTQLNEGYYSTFFRVRKKLGRGGSGTVELVEHCLDGEGLGVYAVKKSKFKFRLTSSSYSSYRVYQSL